MLHSPPLRGPLFGPSVLRDDPSGPILDKGPPHDDVMAAMAVKDGLGRNICFTGFRGGRGPRPAACVPDTSPDPQVPRRERLHNGDSRSPVTWAPSEHTERAWKTPFLDFNRCASAGDPRRPSDTSRRRRDIPRVDLRASLASAAHGSRTTI